MRKQSKTTSCFGIGCFHFGVNNSFKNEFNCKYYTNELRKVLESVEGIENVSIFLPSEFEKEIFYYKEKPPRLHEGDKAFPFPSFLIIDFDVFIPFKKQSTLLGKYEKLAPTGSEEFSVSIIYSYFAPVAFIKPINPLKTCKPSNGVFLVRIFLINALEELNSDINFEFLGPSPFHAECYINLRKEIKNLAKDITRCGDGFCSVIDHTRGYDNISFYADKSFLKDIDEAEEKIWLDIKDELNFFYYITGLGVRALHDWDKINKKIEAIKNIKKRRIINNFKLSKLIDEANNLIVELEIDAVFNLQEIHRDTYNIYSRSNERHFEYSIKQRVENLGKFPSKELVRILEFYEQRRTKWIGNFLVLISAIVGGIIGALITYILTNS